MKELPTKDYVTLQMSPFHDDDDPHNDNGNPFHDNGFIHTIPGGLPPLEAVVLSEELLHLREEGVDLMCVVACILPKYELDSLCWRGDYNTQP